MAITAVIFPVLAEESAFAQGLTEQAPAASQTATTTVTAALAPGFGREARAVAVPKPLSNQDAQHYAKAFQLEAAGQWGSATRELALVSDSLLKGHLLARHYMSTSSRPVIEELQAWMADYSDLPQAEDVYRLAVEKAGRFAATSIKAPLRGSLKGTSVDTTDDGANWEEMAFGNDPKTAQGHAFMQKLRKAFHSKQSELAEGILHEAALKGIDPVDLDQLKLLAAMNYFTAGQAREAAGLASDVADRSGDDLPASYWLAGLAEWRSGHADKARRHFEHLAEAPTASSWMMAAGAFWSARANLVAHHPELVNHWLEIAATYPRTFYGLLARRVLGYETLFTWTSVPFTEADSDVLMRVPGGRRALALLQIGQRQAAEDEVRKAYPWAGKSLRQSMLALAQSSEMEELSVRLGGLSSGQANDAIAYPVPQWAPKNGWTMDRALIYAFIRQESRFNPSARSARGAGGLMQIMPATATAIAGSRAKERLSDPEYNLSLGQRYLTKLLNEDPVNGNLIYLAAAYNAGPGKVAQWIDAFGRTDDPLLFIESLPSRETRTFIERIMTNYWVYRGRLGLPSTSLDQIATGQWPTYDNGVATAKVRNASTR
jgi:soluble lytic murein transglycosylase-like protein